VALIPFYFILFKLAQMYNFGLKAVEKLNRLNADKLTCF